MVDTTLKQSVANLAIIGVFWRALMVKNQSKQYPIRPVNPLIAFSASVWDDLYGQIYLNKEEFVKEMQQYVQSDKNISEIPRAQRSTQARPLSYDSSFNDRNAGIAAACQTGDYAMKAIADELGMHYATVSRIVKKLGWDMMYYLKT